MAISKKATEEKYVTSVGNELIRGTDIKKSEFKIVKTKMKGRSAYAIECRDEHTLATLLDNALETYEVEKLSRIVIILYPEVK